jgi:hypothetical protein
LLRLCISSPRIVVCLEEIADKTFQADRACEGGAFGFLVARITAGKAGAKIGDDGESGNA